MDTYKPKSVIETGTWNGGRAIQMALTAFEYSDNFTYKGYDLFEDSTIETDHEEFNSKAHNTMVADGKITQEDLDMIFVTDDPVAARDHIVAGYQNRIAIRAGSPLNA